MHLATSLGLKFDKVYIALSYLNLLINHISDENVQNVRVCRSVLYILSKIFIRVMQTVSSGQYGHFKTEIYIYICFCNLEGRFVVVKYHYNHKNVILNY